jgi:hypothetical protein
MTAIIGSIFVSLVMIGSTLVALMLFRRQRKSRRLQTPEPVRFRRGAGETLRRRMDDLSERFVTTILVGSCVTIALLGIPGLVLKLVPNANPFLLFGSGIALFGAGAVAMIRRSVRLLDERAKARLGFIGEGLVAESLEVCLARGYRVYHDFPIEGDWGKANIDHVVVGPNGLAVVETKMRTKPSDKRAWENRVTYDGEVLAWPRCPDDSKTLWQVRKNAEWLEAYLLKECGFSFPVKKVIAIPGWNVVEKVLAQPRVVTGRGAGDAVLQALDANAEARFSKSQVERLAAALDALCRDVEV